MTLKKKLFYNSVTLGKFMAACMLVLLAMTVWPEPGNARENAVAANETQTTGKAMNFAADDDFEVTELWTGKVYSSTFRIGACFSSHGKFRGVLHLRQSNGEVDIYHFFGTVARNLFQASHASGHSFSGELIGNDRVEGSIQLKNGLNINIEGRRQQNVRLDMSDCSPMPSE